MIEAIVTVGIYNTERDIINNGIICKLPQLPSVGDLIIPTASLKPVLERTAKEWGVEEGCPINYVKAIGWLDVMPVVMLSFNPRKITVYCYYNNKEILTTVDTLPRINDMIGFKDKNFSSQSFLYVRKIYHFDGDVNLELGDEPADNMVTVANDTIGVNVLNRVDTYIENDLVDVNINKCYTVLDVRSY